MNEQEIVATFLKFNPRKIILFGSMATDSSDEHSDVDLIIVYDTSKRFLDRLAELYMSWPFPRSVDILAYTPEEFEEMLQESYFLQDIVTEGKVLYEISS